MTQKFTAEEASKLQKYLQTKFGNKNITTVHRKDITDSLEVLLAGEFLAVIYKDEEEGEVSYDFNMAILDMDLE